MNSKTVSNQSKEQHNSINVKLLSLIEKLGAKIEKFLSKYDEIK